MAQRRPYSMWLSGVYPRVLDGLCKALSLDMRVCDVAWIGMKLRKLLNYAEANGSFMARIPGSDKAQTWPSTIAYLARLMIHRYAMLGLLTERIDAGGLQSQGQQPRGLRELRPYPSVDEHGPAAATHHDHVHRPLEHVRRLEHVVQPGRQLGRVGIGGQRRGCER